MHAWSPNFQDQYFCDTQGINKIHKNIVSQKFEPYGNFNRKYLEILMGSYVVMN